MNQKPTARARTSEAPTVSKPMTKVLSMADNTVAVLNCPSDIDDDEEVVPYTW